MTIIVKTILNRLSKDGLITLNFSMEEIEKHLIKIMEDKNERNN